MAHSNFVDEEAFWPDEWIYAMIASGFFSAICIVGMFIHSLWHFTHDKTKVTGWLRYLYLSAFLANALTSLQYATLKVDLLLPVGTSKNILLSCKVSGYPGSICGLGVCKVLLFSLFLFRIDMTFHGSALAYPRKNLLLFGIFYACLAVGLVSTMLFFAQDVIEYRQTDSGIGVCSIFKGNRGTLYTQASYVLSDTIVSLLVVWLFVRKLRQVCCTLFFPNIFVEA